MTKHINTCCSHLGQPLLIVLVFAISGVAVFQQQKLFMTVFDLKIKDVAKSHTVDTIENDYLA